MILDEFYNWLKNQPIEDKIVYMRYKYSWEKKWTYSNEYLETDTQVDGFYVWKYDWDEGQDVVEILGCVDVSAVNVPLFELQKENDPVMGYLLKEASEAPEMYNEVSRILQRLFNGRLIGAEVILICTHVALEVTGDKLEEV